MSQSSTIAFFILAGFVVYITIKGELTSYAGILGIGPKATTTPNAAASNSSSLGTAIQNNQNSPALNPLNGLGSL